MDDNSLSKESTCKGALMGKPENVEEENVVLKSRNNTLIADTDTYEDIDELYKKDVLKTENEFFDFFFNLNADFNLDDNFGVSKVAVDEAKTICGGSDVKTFLDKGIELVKQEVDETDKIEETLFFYPIKGLLQSLSQSIYSNIHNRE